MPKKLTWFLISVGVLIGIIFAINFFTLNLPVSNHLSEDYRNESLEMSVRYSYYVNPNRIAISLDKCEEAAPVDILRGLLQTAEALKSRSFSKVELYKGFDHRFTLSGKYFKQLGEEYDFQNPVYTARTLPEKLTNPDGTKAYYNFRSGFAGLSEEMETFSEFTVDWCK